MAAAVLGALRRLNYWLAIVIGIALLGCAAFVLLDIVLRQFNASFGGTDEISGYAMAITSAWGMSYALLELGHVRIDLLRSRLVTRSRVLIDLVSMLVVALMVTVIAFQCWPVLEKSLTNNSRANTVLETPLWMVQLPWLAGWVWFALMAWLSLMAALWLFLHGQFDDVEQSIGTVAETKALS